MANRTCPNCQAPVGDQQFCPECGTRLQPSGGYATPQTPNWQEPPPYTPPTMPVGSTPPPPPADFPPSQPPYNYNQPPTYPPYPQAGYPQPPQPSRAPVWIFGLIGVAVLAIVGGLFFWLGQNSTGTPTATAIALLPTSTPRSSVAVIVNTPTPEPLPTNEPAQDFILVDDFSTKDEGWPEGPTSSGSGSYAYIDDAYQISVEATQRIIWTSTIETYSDVDMQIDITARQGSTDNAAGLIIREQENSSLYTFQISPVGEYAFRRFDKPDDGGDGEWTNLIDWTYSSVVNADLDATNRLRVVAVGPLFELYLNGQLIDRVTDTTYTDGAMGFGVSTFDEGDTVMEFDNFQFSLP